MKRPSVELNPNGKWRVGDVIGKVPKGHDCIIEGFMLRGGKVIEKGKVIYINNGGKEVSYTFRNNDVG